MAATIAVAVVATVVVMVVVAQVATLAVMAGGVMVVVATANWIEAVCKVV